MVLEFPRLVVYTAQLGLFADATTSAESLRWHAFRFLTIPGMARKNCLDDLPFIEAVFPFLEPGVTVSSLVLHDELVLPLIGPKFRAARRTVLEFTPETLRLRPEWSSDNQWESPWESLGATREIAEIFDPDGVKLASVQAGQTVAEAMMKHCRRGAWYVVFSRESRPDDELEVVVYMALTKAPPAALLEAELAYASSLVALSGQGM